MNTKTNKKSAKSGLLDDLHRAIASQALVRASEGAVIIASEQTGARQPWIFDFRAVMLQPKWLDSFAELFWERYEHRLPFQVGGMETAGIPLVTAIVMKGAARGTPVNGFFIRKSAKRQGLMKTVEGTLTDEKIILLDDLINSGQTVTKQVDLLREHGKTVSDVFVLLAFRAKDAYTSLREKGASLTSLFTLKDFDMPLLAAHAPEVPRPSFEIVWRYAEAEPSRHLVVQKSAPLFDGALLYAGYDDGVFRAHDAKTGAVVWEFSTERHPAGKGILSSPALHDDTVYFGAYDGNCYALDAHTGKKKWVNRDADWIGSSPCVAPSLNLVFIGLEFGLFHKRGGIAALDCESGAVRWRAAHTAFTHGSPLYIEEESLVVIGSNDGVLYAYDAATGDLRWTFGTRSDIKTRASYDPKRRSVVFGSLDGTVYALAARDGTPLFAREAGPLYSIPLIVEDTVYICSLDKCVYALDASTGDTRWIYETGGRIFASPVMAEGSLWTGSNDGRLYEIDPASGALRNFFQMTERIVNAIAYDVSSKHFFVPTQTNELYCLKRGTPNTQ